jgi:capsular exopolysaccharide synthesis family protein
VDEQRLLAALWRGRYILFVAMVSSVLVALIATERAQKVYAGAAIVQVGQALPGSNQFDPLTEQQASAGLAKSYATLLNDQSFVNRLRERIGTDMTTSELQASLSPTAIQDTALLKIGTESFSPESARRLADSVANAFVGIVQSDSRKRNARLQAELERSVTNIANEMERLQRSASGRPNSLVDERLSSLRGARAALTNQLGQLVSSSIQEGGNVYVTAPPTAYQYPIRPRKMLNLLAGLALGALIGVSLVYLRSVLDRGLRSSAEAEALLKAPLVATIPLRNPPRPGDPALDEAYDVLRANLAFLSVEQDLHVVTLTSYNVGEGKSSVTEGLAWAASRAATDMLIIDGDLRTRTLSSRLGYDRARGLTSVLNRGLSYRDAIIELAPHVSFMPAGQSQQKASGLLSSTTMAELVTELREHYPLIVLDSPPAAALADAPILASLSDGFVLVSRIGVTKRADLRAAASKLQHSGAPIVGVVTLEPQADVHPMYLYPPPERLWPRAAPAGTVPSQPGVEDVPTPASARWVPAQRNR